MSKLVTSYDAIGIPNPDPDKRDEGMEPHMAQFKRENDEKMRLQHVSGKLRWRSWRDIPD